MTDSISMYRLVALNGPDPDWRIVVRDERVVLGRNPECRVHVDYPKVADRHLELCLKDGQVRMRVLEEADPVKIRGESVTEGFLRHGDVLEFSDLHLQFQVIQPATVYHTRAPDVTQTVATVGVVLVLTIQVVIIFGLWLTGRGGEDRFVFATAEAVEEPPIPNLSRFGLDDAGEGLTLRIWKDIAEERFDEADAGLTELEAMLPDHEITFAARALLLEKQSRFDDAIALYDSAVTRFSDSPHLALIKAERARLEAAAAIAAAVEVAEQDTSEIDAVLAQAEAPAAVPASVPVIRVPRTVPADDLPARHRPEGASPRSPPEAAGGASEVAASQVHLDDEPEALPGAPPETLAGTPAEPLPETLPEPVPEPLPEPVAETLPESKPEETSGPDLIVASEGSEAPAADLVVASVEPEDMSAVSLPVKAVVREPAPEPPTVVVPPPSSEDQPAAPPLSRIRIASMQREKFMNRESYDEIRLIRIALSPRKSAGRLQPEKLRVDVQFFDRDLESGAIERSAVPTPTKGLRVQGEWTGWESQSLSALYMVPRGFREREKEVGAGEKQFYGYVVKVYYDDVVQDEAAFPSSLID